MRVTKPLFHFDAGWLYVVAGLAICAAAILVPVQQDLRGLRDQLENIRSKEHLVTLQLQGSSELLDLIDEGDQTVVRRLAASQLNLMPAGHIPLLRSVAPGQTVTDWVNGRIRYEQQVTPAARRSMIDRMAMGVGRLWLFGLGAFCVFLGLLLDPAMGAINRLRTLRLSYRRAKGDRVEAVAIEMVRAAGDVGFAGTLERDVVVIGADGDGSWTDEVVEGDVALDESLVDVSCEEIEEGDVERDVDPVAEDEDEKETKAGLDVADQGEIETNDDSEVIEDEIGDDAAAEGDDENEVDASGEEAAEVEVVDGAAVDEAGMDEAGDEDGAAADEVNTGESEVGEEDDEWEYVDEDASLPDEDDEYEYEYEYVYVDEDGNEIEADEAKAG